MEICEIYEILNESHNSLIATSGWLLTPEMRSERKKAEADWLAASELAIELGMSEEDILMVLVLK